MTTRSYYVIMVVMYIVAALMMIFIDQMLVVIFIMLVLMMYQVVWFSYYQNHLDDTYQQNVRELEYQLSQTVRYRDETRSQFTSLAELLGSGFILIDEHEDIKEINGYLKKTFNVNQCIDKPYDVLKKHKALYNIIHEAFLSEKETRGQIVHDDRYFDVNSTPIFEGNMYRGCLLLIHDITQIKNAETFQKQFTADVSHELKTPLSAIKGLSEIMMRDTDMTKKEREDFIRMVHHESTRLEIILNDLLIISKMDRLDYELTREKASIKALLDEVIELLKPLADKKKLTLEGQVEDYHLHVDKVKMRQVLINLVENGLNYTDEGSVTVKGYKDTKHYVIEVKDTGIGIKKSDQEKVFKRFYRVDDARSRASGGSGLGLSIIKNVVKKHGGTIVLTSEINRGSTFKVLLPIVEEIR